MQHSSHSPARFPSSSTLLRSCFMKSCRPSEQPWPPHEETRKVPRPANSRSQTVLVSWGEGLWDAVFLSHLLSCEWHLWSPCCSVQCSRHLLRQRPLWLPPQAALWKSPERQQQVRGEGGWGVFGALHWGWPAFFSSSLLARKSGSLPRISQASACARLSPTFPGQIRLSPPCPASLGE